MVFVVSSKQFGRRLGHAVRSSFCPRRGLASASIQEIVQQLVDREAIVCSVPQGHLNDLSDKPFRDYPKTVYAGFDPTADSLHVGHLPLLTVLCRFYFSGCKVLLIVGGGTAALGDPSGKTSQRQLLPESELNRNAAALIGQLQQVFSHADAYLRSEEESFTGGGSVEVLNNDSWYRQWNVLEFMCEVARVVPLGPLLRRRHVKERLDAHLGGMTVAEFSYQLFQGYDWFKLWKEYDCNLQIGGQDQLGNFETGRWLIHQEKRDVDVAGLCLPLITRSADSKEKIGKSTSGDDNAAVWLSATKTSPFQFYQWFWRTDDDDCGRMLRLFTLRSMEEIEALLSEPSKTRIAQTCLAESATLLVHGREALEQAQRCSHVMFSAASKCDLFALSVHELQMLADGSHTHYLLFSPTLTVGEMAVHCLSNEKKATNIVAQGGFYLNLEKVTDFSRTLDYNADVVHGYTVLRIGKRNHFFIKWQSKI